MSGRRRVLGAVAMGAVVIAVAGAWASSLIKSPQEAAAEREAPQPSVLSAVVEQRPLTDTVIIRGTVEVAGSFSVAPTAPASGRALVTGVRVSAGDKVSSGDVLLEVSGRPVIVLAGKKPAYRDLRPDAAGDDVAQLQKVLADLGFSSSPDDEGHFGSGTKEAVEEFYDSIGFAVPTTGDEEAVAAAEDAMTAAERALELAERDLERLRDEAEQAEEEPEPGATGQPSPSGPDDDAIEDAEYAVQTAEEDLASAQSDYWNAVTESGPMLPLAEYTFSPRLPATVEKVHLGLGDALAGKAVTLSTGDVVVTSRIDTSTRDLLSDDMPVEIFSERMDVKVGGTIASIGEFTDDSELGPGHTLRITPDEKVPRDLIGADVRLTFTAASTQGEVLVVPLSAVSATADGTTVVVRLGDDGVQERVTVSVGVSGDGFIEVAPEDPGALGAGDRVVVGAR